MTIQSHVRPMQVLNEADVKSRVSFYLTEIEKKSNTTAKQHKNYMDIIMNQISQFLNPFHLRVAVTKYSWKYNQFIDNLLVY